MADQRRRDWASAYLSQARADLAAARIIAGQREGSVFAVLMQMAFEKIAKAAMLRNGTLSLRQARSSHEVSFRFLQYIRRQQRTAIALGFHSAEDFFLATVEIAELLTELERANPQVAARLVRATGAVHPTLEYPWEQEDAVLFPEENHPFVLRIKRPELNMKGRMIKFADLLIGRFELAFPFEGSE